MLLKKENFYVVVSLIDQYDHSFLQDFTMKSRYDAISCFGSIAFWKFLLTLTFLDEYLFDSR